MKIIYLSLILLLSNIFFSCSEDSPAEATPLTFAEQMQKALNDGIVTYKGKGVSVAVIMPDGETWCGGSGMSHANIPITTDMVFSAGKFVFRAVGSALT